MGNGFRNFMGGRYGGDQLSRFMLIVAIIFMATSWVLSIFYPDNNAISSIFSTLSLVLLVWNIVRMMSRNIPKRQAQNEKYLSIKRNIIGIFKGNRTSRAKDREHKIYKCPSCGQKVRVPRGRGRIAITCPKCKVQFVKRT